MTSNFIHVVYAFKPDNFQAVVVPESATQKQIHEAIAAYENDENKSGRRWSSLIKPGSFMMKRIRGAKDAEHAIKTAQKSGLSYSPIPEAYKMNQPVITTPKPSFKRAAHHDAWDADDIARRMVDIMKRDRRNDKPFRL